ncbi:hypothetical protein SAMN05421682_10349 [Chryseobacterium indoltheticum]|uniref:Uncharacterized protein n=1 Tax=Chryseobacterium indoltheticum TaxID=254 RepID=A0A381FEI7_9FLAO|nr:hypothetical protein SAMN05421682_10349 [Chryseobacterium indoltheticum]SUX44903.1 Uncharacterised protein [Chryseobacterium indoltheticum]
MMVVVSGLFHYYTAKNSVVNTEFNTFIKFLI